MERKKGPGQAPGVDDYIRTLSRLRTQVDDPEALAQALEIRAALDSVILDAVNRLRAEGYSDEALAAPLGCTRQNVRKRWPRPAA